MGGPGAPSTHGIFFLLRHARRLVAILGIHAPPGRDPRRGGNSPTELISIRGGSLFGSGCTPLFSLGLLVAFSGDTQADFVDSAILRLSSRVCSPRSLPSPIMGLSNV